MWVNLSAKMLRTPLIRRTSHHHLLHIKLFCLCYVHSSTGQILSKHLTLGSMNLRKWFLKRLVFASHKYHFWRRTYYLIKKLPSLYTRVGTLIVATIYLQLIQNRYMFRSFTVLQCSHQHCVQPVASDVEIVGYL